MRILVTGGAGYIGSHTALVLMARGHEVAVFDSLVGGGKNTLDRMTAIAGKGPAFFQGDIRRKADLDQAMARFRPEAVIHLAGLKTVPDSLLRPADYYDSNVIGTHTLCQAMVRHGIHRLIFSSSAAVYGDAETMPVTERTALNPVNPYGRTKQAAEMLLEDVADADPLWSVVILRYFNPVGGYAGGLLGENPAGVPDNLMPRICRSAAGLQPALTIFGDDYPTKDGTCVRDYIHVMDLAEGHLAALEAAVREMGYRVYNLGTGTGHSVRELVEAFERVNGVSVPTVVASRRDGDTAVSYADPGRALRELGWQAVRDLDAMCRDAWAWQKTLLGYGKA